MKSLFLSVSLMMGASACFSQETIGDNSPAIRGDGNSVFYGVLDVESAVKNFNIPLLSSLDNPNGLITFSAALQKPGLARDFFQALGFVNSSQILLDFLDAGLDPNLLVVDPDGRQEALLSSAFASQNADAMVTLLNKGAFSHGYQDIHFDDNLTPFFVFPIHRVLSDESFSKAEKERIVLAMNQNGVFLFGDEDWEVGKTTLRALEILSEFRETADIEECGQIHCPVKELSCPPTEDVPKKIYLIADWRDLEYGRLDWLMRLGSFGGSEKHLYLGPNNWGLELVVAEFSVDFTSARLLKHQSPSAGMGHCYPETNGYVYDDCWRSFYVTIDRVNDTKAVLSANGWRSHAAEFCGG